MTIFLVDMVSPFRLLPAPEVTLSGDYSKRRCNPVVSARSMELPGYLFPLCELPQARMVSYFSG